MKLSSPYNFTVAHAWPEERMAGRAGIGEGERAGRVRTAGDPGGLENEDLRDEASIGGGGIGIDGMVAGVEGVIGCWFGGSGMSSFITSLVLDSASLAAVDSRRKCLVRRLRGVLLPWCWTRVFFPMA